MKFKSFTHDNLVVFAANVRDVAFDYLKARSNDFGCVKESVGDNWKIVVRHNDFNIVIRISDMEEVSIEILHGNESQLVFMIGKSGEGDNGMKYAVVDFACTDQHPDAMGCLRAVALFTIRKFEELATDARAVYGLGRARSLVHAL